MISQGNRMKSRRRPESGRRRNSRNRRLRHYKRSIVMVCSVWVCLTVILAAGSLRLNAKNAQYKEQEKELKAQISEEKERSEEIKKFEEYVKTDDYIKQTAEEKLGLVDPNEIIFKPVK